MANRTAHRRGGLEWRLTEPVTGAFEAENVGVVHEPALVHGGGDSFAGDDLPVRAEVGEDPRGPVYLVGIAVEVSDFLPNRPASRRNRNHRWNSTGTQGRPSNAPGPES